MLSVSQITTTLLCVVIFLRDFCVFKDIRTRKMIGCGVRRKNMYYLEFMSNSLNKLCKSLTVDGSQGEKNKSKIQLWHRCLGHASFVYVKKLFPGLFAKFNVSSFRCGICELAKIHHASFPLSLNKSPIPFMVMQILIFGVHPKSLPLVDHVGSLLLLMIVP